VWNSQGPENTVLDDRQLLVYWRIGGYSIQGPCVSRGADRRCFSYSNTCALTAQHREHI